MAGTRRTQKGTQKEINKAMSTPEKRPPKAKAPATKPKNRVVPIAAAKRPVAGLKPLNDDGDLSG